MLELSDELMFGRGNRRLAFVHPNDPTRCLKTAAPGSSPGEIRRRKVWYKRLRPDHSYDDNHLEVVEYARLNSYVPDPTFGLPRIYGVVETNRGPALEEDLIRNGDGSVAQNLATLLHSTHGYPQMTGQLRTAAAKLTHWLWTNRIVVHDLHLHNLVVRKNEHGLRLFIIDGLGAYSLVPFESRLPYPVSVWRLPGKIRRFNRLLDRACMDQVEP